MHALAILCWHASSLCCSILLIKELKPIRPSIAQKCRDFIRLIVIGPDCTRTWRPCIHLSFFANNFISVFLYRRLWNGSGDKFFFFSIWIRTKRNRISIARHVTLRKYWQIQIVYMLCRAVHVFADLIKYYHELIWWFLTHLSRGNSCYVTKSLIKYVKFCAATHTQNIDQSNTVRLASIYVYA